MNRFIFVIIIIGALAACSPSDDATDPNGNNTVLTLKCDSSTSQALVGCWVSEACVQNIASPGYYQEAVADFRNDGSLVQGIRIYTNSNCSGTPTVSGIPLQESYAVLGPVTTTGGLTANFISLTYAGFEPLYAAIYIDGNGRLCFPADQFDVNGAGAGISPTYTSSVVASVTIDTNSGACLLPMN